ncbi:MAG TPA: OmpA family protein, partial [Cyclobacteriaceae bacterium]|nr:OmpA family protein [Cyclobacteriaceae bacterium]
HFILRKIICFDLTCRKMIGRRKTLHAISFEDYKKRIEKNAKKGEIKKINPGIKTLKPAKPDTLKTQKIPEPAITHAPEPALEVAPPILKADSLIVLNELLFETNSFKLQGQHFSALDAIAKFLLAHPTLEASVSGHTDNTGNERHNVSLSTNRAEAVAEYLISKGVLDDHVTFEGFGSAQPIMTNETAQGRSKNRRVEILIRNPATK